MKNWSKDEALENLEALIALVDSLFEEKSYSTVFNEWLFKVNDLLLEVFGENSTYYQTFKNLSWTYYGMVQINRMFDPQPQIERYNEDEKNRQLKQAKGLLIAAKEKLERSTVDSVYEGKNTKAEASEIVRILTLIDNKLRKVIRDIPQKEKQIQDAFENLLHGADISFSREKEHIEYSSKTYVPDFTFPKLDLTVEIKMCLKKEDQKRIIAEINDDILAYKTKYSNIIFIIYDVGQITDVDRYIGSFEQAEEVIVRIIKH